MSTAQILFIKIGRVMVFKDNEVLFLIGAITLFFTEIELSEFGNRVTLSLSVIIYISLNRTSFLLGCRMNTMHHTLLIGAFMNHHLIFCEKIFLLDFLDGFL